MAVQDIGAEQVGQWYMIVFKSGCVVRSGADKTSAMVGNVPAYTRVEVLETATLPTGDLRGRINAPLRGWLSLGERFVQKLEARKHARTHSWHARTHGRAVFAEFHQLLIIQLLAPQALWSDGKRNSAL